MWDKASQYLQKIGGVILIGVIIIWALAYFPREAQSERNKPNELAMNSEANNQSLGLQNSYLGQLGQFIQPVMSPLGFDWKMSVSLLAGLPAKEIIVSTMGVLYQVEADHKNVGLSAKLTQEEYISGDKKGEKVITIPVALAFLAFVLIYFPCIGVIATIKSESGKLKWALFTIAYTTGVAWIISFLVFQVSSYLLM
jgi:ferrous iron transport protein B